MGNLLGSVARLQLAKHVANRGKCQAVAVFQLRTLLISVGQALKLPSSSGLHLHLIYRDTVPHLQSNKPAIYRPSSEYRERNRLAAAGR